MLEKAVTDFLFLFATIDPLGTMAIFAALVAGSSATNRKRIARKAVLYAGGVLIGSLVLGQIVLTYMGVRMISLQVAGGVILFIFALKMIFSDFSAPENTARSEDDHSIAVFPLAIPSIASPGAIMAIILITDNHTYSIGQQAVTGVVLVLILILTYAAMLLAERIMRVTGRNGASLMVKIMGMLLAALSVELIFEAIGIERWLAPQF